MSRIGKKTIDIVKGVQVTLTGQDISVKGPKGQLAWTVPAEIEVKQEGEQLSFVPREETQRARAMWGMSRSMINNLVVGVTAGYERKLEITGVGYKAAVAGKTLQLSLGYSHDVNYPIPAGVTIATPKPTSESPTESQTHKAPVSPIGVTASSPTRTSAE